MKNKIIAGLLLVLTACGPIIARNDLASQNVIDDLNKRIAEFRQWRDDEKINEEQYYQLAWGAYHVAGETYNVPELVQLAVFGKFQAERLVKSEITRAEYEWLVTEKRTELARQAAAVRQANSTNYLSTTLTLLQILALLGPQSPLAGGPRPAPAQPQAQPQNQVTRCQYLGSGMLQCW